MLVQKPAGCVVALPYDPGDAMPVVGFPGYSVTMDGRVVRGRRVLRPFLGGRGYEYVGLSVCGTVTRRLVHRLVAAAFLTPDPTRSQVNHIDGDKRNNHAANLEWMTPGENNRHARRAGLNNSRPPILSGEQRPGWKISDAQLRDARTRRAAGESLTSMAAELGVSKSTLCKAIKRTGRAS